ncbi:hypothetical protein [Streptomyces sp. WAC 01325]|uniref:hypothetical protein n=1 Tax=Streptomyces sp. WAC 01325 TaxID=2203202 RepID=UPI0021B05E51|nr:hypothetical protein [Streptomyces sp. WAC 01325]
MQERTSTTERYTRGVAAALVAVATLILAANAGPARASAFGDERHEGGVCLRGEGHCADAGILGIADGHAGG